MGEAERMAITPKGGGLASGAWATGAAAARNGRAREAIKAFILDGSDVGLEM